ncbi:hypothetical protein A5724_28555 [Mycobacterium sp. ACS1612]|uniref:hypothetical protein n=1 Tax=Mycobacterium sp. ACS1612 TaxID=1834117 RepID=UPI000801304D|nr:hypothetical protein [Mycobacterium sp. ACS1612]OBF28353.1 hypothetical protein A5724_28555 [Mycobacterium sp. ACS1612]
MEFKVAYGRVMASFDGYRRGMLVEAKYFCGSIQSMPLTRVRCLLSEARRQRFLAKKEGLPLEWHIASFAAAQDICQLFANNGLGDIPVYFTPPQIANKC